MLTMTDGARGDLDAPRADGVTITPATCPAAGPAVDSAAGLAANPAACLAADSSVVPLLELREVSRRFAVRRGFFAEQRLLTAVDAVSLCLYPGESLGLVGESGCGKSTLGRLACGLLAPSEGRALLGGRDLPPAGANSWAAG